MHQVKFHKRALRSLKRIPPDRQKQIVAAIDELADTDDPAAHHSVKAMRCNWKGHYRMRVEGRSIPGDLSPPSTGRW